MMFNGANVTSLTNPFKNLKKMFFSYAQTLVILKEFPFFASATTKEKFLLFDGFSLLEDQIASSLDFSCFTSCVGLAGICSTTSILSTYLLLMKNVRRLPP